MHEIESTPIDISHIPFSRYGAYVSVTAEEGKNPLPSTMWLNASGTGRPLNSGFYRTAGL
ncbi:hypothetical protein FACS189485_20360 [Spirochaetia bacterium]|nr:hypothetical protein FACS189485_20360 [Spirochaetia bacterium]